MTAELTVHTMTLEVLRARAREAQRLIAQAREIARVSFDRSADAQAPPSSEGGDASRRVGLLLDAAQGLLPGMTSFADERPLSSRAKRPESGWARTARVTLRAGTEQALESIERARILEEVADDAAGLIAEIERRSSSMFRAAEVARTDDRVTRS
jgi:hypothetical protein